MTDQNDTIHVLGTTLRVLTRYDNGNDLRLIEMTVPKGTGAPPHFHPWDESFYVSKGTVDLMVDGEVIQGTPGAFVRIPGGTLHGFTGTSAEPAVLLALDPEASETFFRDMDATVQRLPEDVPKAVDVGRRHGVMIFPPDRP